MDELCLAIDENDVERLLQQPLFEDVSELRSLVGCLKIDVLDLLDQQVGGALVVGLDSLGECLGDLVAVVEDRNHRGAEEVLDRPLDELVCVGEE